ncbi:MAG: ferric reductase-like transmembrane domain-containing protein [Actinomycetota bacterium]|nr:ferric reductase-like transmembrane domain-containing protein [Actinomycetota bacterium]
MFPWYVARTSGLIAWALLAASVLWGLAISTRVLKGRPRPAWLLDLHRYLGGIATVFVGVHIVALLGDTYVHFGLASVLIPFASSWHPVAVAWGVTAFYLLLAVEITSLIRTRLPKRLWRATHYASFPLFIVATIHALSAGTDARTWTFEVVAALTVVAVVALTTLRIPSHVQPPRRVAAPTPQRPDGAQPSGRAA